MFVRAGARLLMGRSGRRSGSAAARRRRCDPVDLADGLADQGVEFETEFDDRLLGCLEPLGCLSRLGLEGIGEPRGGRGVSFPADQIGRQFRGLAADEILFGNHVGLARRQLLAGGVQGRDVLLQAPHQGREAVGHQVGRLLSAGHHGSVHERLAVDQSAAIEDLADRPFALVR